MFRRLPIIVCLVFSFALIFVLTSLPVMALTVGQSGGKGLNAEVVPGETYKQNLSVIVDKKEPATDVLIEILGCRDGDNGIEPVQADADSSSYSARTFILPSEITVHCEPGETKDIQVTVTIPSDAKSGGRYAAFRFSTIPKPGATVNMISAIVLPIKFTISGSQLIHTGKIEGITTGPVISGQPIDIFTSFKNTGNHDFNIRGKVEINDTSNNRIIDTLYVNTTSPIPEDSKRIKVSFTPEENLAPGLYSIKSTLTLEDGTLLGEDNGNFQIEEPYTQPSPSLPPTASTIVSPSGAANLSTEDGRISISFRRGAVTSQATISIHPYPPDQLPAAPKNYQLAGSCFRVDGLTGLLVKEATVKVQYTADDLEKAGGNAARLKLARWDEGDNQWSILKTSVDKSNMILTASTNRFYIWAIIVAPPAKVNLPVVIGSSTAGVIIICLVVLYFIRRRE